MLFDSVLEYQIILNYIVIGPIKSVVTTCNNQISTVGVKRMSSVDTELLLIILYNIIALHRNTNIFFLWKSSNLNK